MPMTRIKADQPKPVFGETFRVKLADPTTLAGKSESLLDLEYDATDEGLLAGYFSTFGNADSVGDVIRKGAFTKTLKERKPRVLWYHDATQPIGVVVDAWEDQKGLFGVIKLNLDVQKGREAFALYKSGAMDSFSIGFQLEKFEVFENEKGYNSFDIKEVRLFEVSAVTFPANEQAVVTDVKQHYEESLNEDVEPVDQVKADEFGAYLDNLLEVVKSEKPSTKLMVALDELIKAREADEAAVAEYLFGEHLDK